MMLLLVRRRWRKFLKYLMLLLLMAGGLWLFYVKVVLTSYMDKQVILISIVEEHHEVLPYWLDGVRFGILPKGNVTVFHVDGHSDEAPPEYVPEIPFFHWPKNDTQERAMLQKNDIFIQMSAAIGFLARFIWLSPSWIEDESLTRRFSSDIVGLGYFYHKSPEPNALPQPYFCDCRRSNLVENAPIACAYVNYSSEVVEDREMKQEACKIETTYISQTLTENYAHKIAIRSKDTIKAKDLQTPLQFGGDEAVIWDIDLDYFGCEIPGDLLIEAKFTWRVVELIDQKLNHLFCPGQFNHEQLSDSIMKDLINVFLSHCEFGAGSSKCKQPFQVIRKLTEDTLTEQWKRSPRMFCAVNDLQLRNAWKDLAFIFHHLTLKQLHALLLLGFCFNISPKTYGVEDNIAVHICHGLNAPDSEAVEKYSPSHEDIMDRLARLERIMTSLPAPSMVTICRSARDGYVPRQHYIDIENHLLELIRRSQPDKKFRVTYDEDLLGGEKGRDWSAK